MKLIIKRALGIASVAMLGFAGASATELRPATIQHGQSQHILYLEPAPPKTLGHYQGGETISYGALRHKGEIVRIRWVRQEVPQGSPVYYWVRE